jgi:AcrR family transcriptional regulator
MEGIAQAAGCSRATLYRYYQDKDDVVRAILLRKASKLAARLASELRAIEDPAQRIAEGILRAVDAVRAERWFRSPDEAGAAAAIARVGGGPHALAQSLAPMLRPAFEAMPARGGIRLRTDVTPQEAAEWLLLTTLGMLTMNMPVSRTREEQASFLRRFVAYTLIGPRRR